jgi:hypothetical protein
MTKLITFDRAKKEIERLQHYVDVIESYPIDTTEDLVIREYAITNSIVKVTEKLNLEREYVTSIIKGRSRDELHKLVKSGYMSKKKVGRNRVRNDNATIKSIYSKKGKNTDIM